MKYSPEKTQQIEHYRNQLIATLMRLATTTKNKQEELLLVTALAQTTALGLYAVGHKKMNMLFYAPNPLKEGTILTCNVNINTKDE